MPAAKTAKRRKPAPATPIASLEDHPAYDAAFAVALQITRAIRPLVSIVRSEDYAPGDDEQWDERWVDAYGAAAAGYRKLIHADWVRMDGSGDVYALLSQAIYEVASTLRAVHTMAMALVHQELDPGKGEDEIPEQFTGEEWPRFWMDAADSITILVEALAARYGDSRKFIAQITGRLTGMALQARAQEPTDG